MVELVGKNLEKVLTLCRQYRVQSLYLFGSAANGSFSPGSSDLDFLVNFEPMEPIAHKNAYFGLAFSLEDFFGTEIDLVEEGAICNPYFKEEVDETRVMLYAA